LVGWHVGRICIDNFHEYSIVINTKASVKSLKIERFHRLLIINFSPCPKELRFFKGKMGQILQRIAVHGTVTGDRYRNHFPA
jgi:hypothetical protein